VDANGLKLILIWYLKHHCVVDQIYSRAPALSLSQKPWMCQHINTIYRRIKEGALRPHSNAMKPRLTEANKKARLEFCFSMLDHCSWTARLCPCLILFSLMTSDFTCQRPHKDIISSLMELSLLRAGKRKSFITKIMFLAAVARH